MATGLHNRRNSLAHNEARFGEDISFGMKPNPVAKKIANPVAKKIAKPAKPAKPAKKKK